MSSAYCAGMFARVVTMLAMSAIAVTTAVTFAHAAGLSAAPDHAIHASEMIQVTDGDQHACEDVAPCAQVDTGACEFVCAGFALFSPASDSGAVRNAGLAGHDLPRGTVRASRTAELNERPPKLRLL
ncbi:hypothetical protein [uncultured Paracoccus sp.]|uniref:hypothetical protein n=1 Tax=uncultured Paracoccus sp. TaxID=189685 RepID=UPI002630E53F|nr:hypothetical protein [uncultured Paracoccus sp.]